MTTDVHALLERLGRIDASSLSDADKALRVLPATLRPVSTGGRMVGRALTAAAEGDLMSVMGGLLEGRPGDVLVVSDRDGSGTLALAGELFATEAIRRGMAGVVLDGPCRDTGTLAGLALPFYARGDLLLGDSDGIVARPD